MCRLALYLGPPRPLAPLVFGGTHPLAEQAWAPRELLTGSVNADGWGVAWFTPQGPVRLAAAEPVWYDPDLPAALGAVESSAQLAVLRNATVGLFVDRAGLQPFVGGGWAFALNGYVQDFRPRFMRAFRAELPDALYGELRGCSDAETLFLLLRARLDAGAPAARALQDLAAWVVAEVRAVGAEAQLTMALVGPGEAHAVRTGTAERTNTLYAGRGCAVGPAGVVVASEPLTDEAVWEAVPEHHALEVRADGSVRVERLAR
ncbi:MAG: hypothetical protein D6701_05635 [Gemmatimonadetes bacterium]|nr:MAG: hypothetical protein D6701_05635 [Gemmatimonadota bacterium]